MLVGVFRYLRWGPIESGKEVYQFLTGWREGVGVKVLVGDTGWISQDYIGNYSSKMAELTDISLQQGRNSRDVEWLVQSILVQFDLVRLGIESDKTDSLSLQDHGIWHVTHPPKNA